MPKRILVVEDNDKNRMLVRDLLRYHGYEVIEAVDGETGVRAAKEQLPDLILMDIQMPVMDGYSAIRLLKSDPATKGIKIIATTSSAMKGDKEKIIGAGADDYVSKPLDTRKLPLIVKKHLSA